MTDLQMFVAAFREAAQDAMTAKRLRAGWLENHRLRPDGPGGRMKSLIIFILLSVIWIGGVIICFEQKSVMGNLMGTVLILAWGLFCYPPWKQSS